MDIIGAVEYFITVILFWLIAYRTFLSKSELVRRMAILFFMLGMKNLYVTVVVFVRQFDFALFLVLVSSPFLILWMFLLILGCAPFAIGLLKRNGNG